MGSPASSGHNYAKYCVAIIFTERTIAAAHLLDSRIFSANTLFLLTQELKVSHHLPNLLNP